jgi:molybdate transport system substrate-binding protein
MSVGLRQHILFILAALLTTAAMLAPVRAEDSPAADPPVIAAASDLQFALVEAAQAFHAETGLAVELAFGSSGNLVRQIRQGAPFQMFLSADEDFIRPLAAEGLTEGEGDLYAIGRIAILVPRGSRLKPDGTLRDLSAALSNGSLERFAIANPEHAPYGRRAEEALRHAGLWNAIKDKLVLGENVSQAAQFALSGAADGGLVAYSLAVAPNVSKRGDHALIRQDWHAPLRQRMVLLRSAGETARRFYAFVAAPSGRAILKRYGFVLPGETM